MRKHSQKSRSPLNPIKKPNMKRLIGPSGATAFFFALWVPVSASAQQIEFQLEGTFTQAGLGYSAGQPFSFKFLLNNYAPATPAGNIAAGGNGVGSVGWIDNTVGVPQVWNAVSGTGLTGQWMPNVTSASQVAIAVTAQGLGANGTLTLAANSGSGAFVNGLPLDSLQMANVYDNFRVVLPGPVNSLLPPDPTTFFSGHLGVYQRDQAFTPTGRMEARGNNGAELLFFTADTLTISSVPEPTSLGIFGGLLLVLARLFPRRPQQPSRHSLSRSATNSPGALM